MSLGWAPTLNQYSIRSRFSEVCFSGVVALGSYQPSCSIALPLRGERESIAFKRKKLRCRRPILFSLNRTATYKSPMHLTAAKAVGSN